MPTAPAETANEVDNRRLARFRERERAIGALADSQYGVVTRSQLKQMGFTEAAIARRIAGGRLHQVRRGIYAPGRRVLSRQGRWMAAVLASGPDAVLSHWSAAALWMIRPNSRSLIDVTTPHKSRTWDGIRRHHKPLLADEVAVKKGIPVTGPCRTAFDLAATEPLDVVENLIREMEFLRLSDRLSLSDLIRRYPGRRGVRRLRVALERLEEDPAGRRRSPLEERFSPFLRRHRLPLPRYNDWISVGDGKRYQVDCHWPDLRLIVELDGWEAHGSKSAFHDDRARDRRLEVAGYSVTHITWSHLDVEPAAVAADLRALLTQPVPASLPD
jgi:very-short-patch-repair endonuclease